MTTTTPTRPHWPDLTALALVALTAAVAVAAAPRLPAEVAVGWRLGLDGTVSRTVAPRLVGVALFPVLSLAWYALFPVLSLAWYALLRTVRAAGSLDGAREQWLFALLVHLPLAALAVCQVAVVVANLA